MTFATPPLRHRRSRATGSSGSRGSSFARGIRAAALRPLGKVTGLPGAIRRRHAAERDGERGQVLIIFTIAIVAIIAVAGLLVDGGMAWTNRRMAQNGADVAALAAAKSYSTSGSAATATTAANSIAATNGYAKNYTDCSGRAKNDGVTVNIPPASGAHSGQSGYAEVIVQRPMKTSFSALLGQSCWMVSARAVAVASNNDVATCNFCSLNNSSKNHTLVINAGANLRVDGDIVVDSSNGGYTPGTCQTQQWNVCGDAFDVFGAGGTISAKTISVTGGWETHNNDIAVADAPPTGCAEYPKPPSQSQQSNVCIHVPAIADPLNDPSKPGSAVQAPSVGSAPAAGTNGCPAGSAVPTGTAASPTLMTITSGNKTICPGTYYGGLAITGGNVTMSGGIYIMVGGGFSVTGSAGVDGRSGVMIYSEGGGSASQSTTTANDLVPAPIAGHQTFKTVDLVASPSTVDANGSVTFTLTLTPASNGLALPTGTVDFYDGDVQICAASPLIQIQNGHNPVKATCVATFPIYGTRAISAVYTGDSIYNAAGDTATETVRTPNGVTTGPILIQTTGKVDLYGPTTGPYSGLTLFQDRASNLTMRLSPGGSHAPGCPGNFMTAGVGADTNPVPNPCGAMGGLQGTIYAPNQDALVMITSSGMADLQVIAGKIEVDSGASSRFGFDASKFANSSIHLVE
jgi:Flp pilus assembly protein TadG